MAADVRCAIGDLRRAFEIVFENARRRVIANDQPGGSRPFFVIERIFAGGDFAPSGEAIGDHLDQHHVTLLGPAEAGLEKVHQRHADLAQDDAF